jgi:hypothetical protein
MNAFLKWMMAATLLTRSMGAFAENYEIRPVR